MSPVVLRPQDTLGAILRECGITYRQFDHWCRQGWVPGLSTGFGSGVNRSTGQPYNNKNRSYFLTAAQTERLRLLARASRIRGMRLDELADALNELSLLDQAVLEAAS